MTVILILIFAFIFNVDCYWTGANYWTSRYSSDGINYIDDEDSGILWNYYLNGRHAYEPRSQYVSVCGQCQCQSGVIDCSSASGTV